MGITRTFEDFRPPARYDGIPFVSVVVQESATEDGAYTDIDTIALTPQDLDPSHPQSRDLTTANAQLDPGWYILVWTDSTSGFFPSEPISSLRGLEPFITREELADFMGRGEDLSDSEIAFTVIEGACDTCRNITEQQIGSVTGDAITFDGSGTDALLLPQLPVTQVTSVEVDGDVVTDYKLNGNGVLLRDAPGVWPKRRQSVSVVYSHGYTNVPGDLRVTALSIAARLLTQASTGAISSESLGQYSVTYNSAVSKAGDLTPSEHEILRRYRRAS